MKVNLLSRLARTALALALAAFSLASLSAQDAKRLLVVTVTKGFRHSSIPTAEKVLGVLAEKSGVFTVDYARTDADLTEKMTLANLKTYDGVIFANTTGDLPLPDREGFMEWIRSGKAFVGMHSASDTFHGFPPYIEMVGGEFLTHGAQAKVECINQDPNHPACQHFGPTFEVYDEIYIFKNFHRPKVRGLLSLDREPNKKTLGDYPVAWCKEIGNGKMFYTSLGHREDVWESEPYQKHILGGIKWALGLAKGDATPQGFFTLRPEPGFQFLANGRDLSGWKLRNPGGAKSWSVQNGILVNEGHGTDLLTEEKFKDFTVRYEYRIPADGSNSGFYLRGRHEIQIYNDFDRKEPRNDGNGAIYSFKAPSEFASRKQGEWQEVEATIQGNRVTVTLNGKKIHDAVEVTRATGGELDKNLDEPGPILLQGDHGSIHFRNIRIKPL